MIDKIFFFNFLQKECCMVKQVEKIKKDNNGSDNIDPLSLFTIMGTMSDDSKNKMLDEMEEAYKVLTIKAVENIISMYSVNENKKDNHDYVNDKLLTMCSFGIIALWPLCHVHFVPVSSSTAGQVYHDCRGCPLASITGRMGCHNLNSDVTSFFRNNDFLGFYQLEGEDGKHPNHFDAEKITDSKDGLFAIAKIIKFQYEIVRNEIIMWSKNRFLKNGWIYYDWNQHFQFLEKEKTI